MKGCIARVNVYSLGWIGFFRICTEAAVPMFTSIEGRLRRRLRAMILHDWRRKSTIARRLLRLGIRPRDTWHIYQGRRSWWALSHIRPVDHGLSKAYFAKRGLVSLKAEWKRLQPEPSVPPAQPALVQG